VTNSPAHPLTEFWVVRHGETLWNASGQAQGHTDIELSDEGRSQARQLAVRLSGLSFSALYSSDLLRARETAEIAGSLLESAPLPVLLEPRLREIDVGYFAGKNWREIHASFPEYYESLKSDPWGTKRPGGESMADLYARVQGALLELSGRHPGEKVLIFTHGGVVRVAVSLALGGGLQDVWARLSIENTSITRMLYGEGGGKLLSYNDVAHLERSKTTEDDSVE